jgi:carbonic anhydrase
MNSTNARKIKIYQHRYFKFDLIASIVVFLVAIPLCLGIALASGTPLFSGLISGIIGGIIVGILSQSSVSVSGPAAGLVAVVLSAVSQLGGFEHFLFALILAGIIQIIIGACRAGFIANYIPSNVVRGLLCAIGVLIILKQLPLAFTHAQSYEALLTSLRDTAKDYQWQPVLHLASHLSPGACLITIISLYTLIFFDKTKHSWLKNIPGAIVVVLLGVGINEIFDLYLPSFTQDMNHLVNIPVSHSINEFFHQFTRPNFSHWQHWDIYLNAVILAVVASLETLLNLEGAIKLDQRHRPCSADRELIAQGVGNTLAGFLGGLPITSVVVRTSVNIQAGARTKFATILHGLLILACIMLVPNWLNRIPLAALASILIYSGYKLSHPSIYRQIYTKGMAYFIPFVTTVIAITLTTLLTGILIGLAVSFFFILRQNSQARLDILNERHPAGEVKRILLPAQITFLSKGALTEELASIPEQTTLVIDASHTQYIDQDILELLEDFKDRQAIDKSIQLSFTGFKKKYDIHDQIELINVTTYDIQSALNPKEVLTILTEGNQRFLKDTPIHRNVPEEIRATSKEHYPIAIVLSCIDSRMPIESMFDVGVGDVFVARVAGNIVNPDILASIEFACQDAGAKLIVVLGHTRCGAITAACTESQQYSGHLKNLIQKIRDAHLEDVHLKEESSPTNSSTKMEPFIHQVTRENITHSVAAIYHQSQNLRELIDTGHVGLIGALYDVHTGKVQFDQEFFR